MKALSGLLLSVPALFWCLPSFAHGAKITYQQTQAIQIQASYDQGEPMADAQVVIYAPSDPSKAWLTGTTDSQGRFTFVPDVNQVGNWDVKVRQGGHGSLISIPVEALATATPTPTPTPSSTYTNSQKILMAATGIWGFVGTALFFSRRVKG